MSPINEKGARLESANKNSERIYVVSATQYTSLKLDLNEKSRVSGTKNFEFGIAKLEYANSNCVSLVFDQILG